MNFLCFETTDYIIQARFDFVQPMVRTVLDALENKGPGLVTNSNIHSDTIANPLVKLYYFPSTVLLIKTFYLTSHKQNFAM